MILSFQTDRPGQTVQTQIKLLLEVEEQSDQGLHCLQFSLHLLDALLYGKATLFNFSGDYSKFSGVQIFRSFTVVTWWLLESSESSLSSPLAVLVMMEPGCNIN